ncbi:hypothetical protein [Kitasatospora sp. NPDC093806]|uniref:hypothetical protein n=1 Tax=Kitasatospora sp. NPDC093806 TaxID=3155075 RepID=UPI0034261E0D
MPAEAPHALPDVAIGRHPNHGIIASLPTKSAAAQWMLERLDFRQLPGSPHLYALTDQHREAPERAAWAAKLLTGAGYRVHTDMPLAPENASSHAQTQERPATVEPERTPAPEAEPEIAFAEHPTLGIVGAAGDHYLSVGDCALSSEGWRHHPGLDVYLPPPGTRAETLDSVARITVDLQQSNLQVAMMPGLAEEIAALRAPAQQAFTTHKFRVDEAALKAPATPVSPPPAAVDPRIAYAHAR